MCEYTPEPMKTAAIIDYGLSNIDSVARAVEECGATAIVTSDPRELARVGRIILPGVGSFADGMRELRSRRLDDAMRAEVIEKDVPLLGICLGMQLLATSGDEGGKTAGLDFVEGDVVRLSPLDATTRIPHIGWNSVDIRKASPLFDDIPSGKDFYFVHSYHFRCDAGVVVAETDYCGGFVSCVSKGHIFGVQFHPEKSQKVGLHLLRNFLRT